LSEPLF